MGEAGVECMAWYFPPGCLFIQTEPLFQFRGNCSLGLGWAGIDAYFMGLGDVCESCANHSYCGNL